MRFPNGSQRKVERVDRDDAEADLDELLRLRDEAPDPRPATGASGDLRRAARRLGGGWVPARGALAIYSQASVAFSSGRERTNFTIIYAQALAHAGELADGVHLAIVGLAEARAFGSARFVSRVQRLYDQLLTTHPAHDSHMVQLHDALATAA